MPTDFLPQIDVAKCTGCELCVKVCPTQTLAMAHKTISNIERYLAVVANPNACDYAGRCQEVCPTKAISLLFEIVPADEPKTDETMRR